MSYDNKLNLLEHIFFCRKYSWRLITFHPVLWQKTSKCKATYAETENSEYITYGLGALDDSCFMAFPMRQDSM